MSVFVTEATFSGSISGTTLTVSAIAAGQVQAGDTVVGAAPGTIIAAFGSNNTTGNGGTGTYAVNTSQNLSSTTLTAGRLIPSLPAPGGATAANSTPVVLALDQGGAASDPAVTDPTASGAVFTFFALLKGIVQNTNAVKTALTNSPGLGTLSTVPAASATGTALGTAPANAKGARLYLPSGASVSFTIASSAPTAAPAITFTVSQSGTGPNWDEDLSAGQMIYVTATTGSPLFRWY